LIHQKIRDKKNDTIISSNVLCPCLWNTNTVSATRMA